MSSAEQQLPDAAAGPPRQQQSTRRGHFGTRLLLAAVVAVVVVASVSVLLARTGVLATNTPASSTVVPASWHTFRDKLGLYTLRFAPHWVAGGGIDSGGAPCSQWECTHEGSTFWDPAQGSGTAYVHIDVWPITPSDRQFYCQWGRLGTGTTFAGFPVKAVPSGGGWAIDTQNDDFVFSIVIPGVLGGHLEGLHPQTPTPVPSSWQATDKVDVQGLLATFQLVDHPQPLAC